MSNAPPGFLVTIRSQPKHGLLYAAVKQYGGVKQLGGVTGISYASLYKWLNLRGYPTSAFPGTPWFYKGRRKRIDAALRKHIGCTIDECWPPEVRQFIDNTKELKSLVFEQSQEVPIVRLTGQVMKQLTYDGGVEETMDREELEQRMEKVLKSLSYREREVLKLRYGFGKSPAFTLEETARVFSLSSERIRQIEARAIRRLRDTGRADELVGFID